ncbi:hypothetical protein D1631_05685 [Chryseobacterium nematophagum]|uniref:Uncharacterized protein n=1 Tax=Chryseobacterium nematophagum TaxID=2305228 RepID=A0A3M7TGW6_9FLAO|nr:hypothetical protein [Chryseobacterium nematophagum]RNA61460.1 hypothetical protein D1631_05685 [Chryseobacterium nematophagum]
MSGFDDFKILNLLSEQLYDDYSNNLIVDKDFMEKMDDIRIKMQEALNRRLDDIDDFAKSIGYVIIRSPKPSLLSCKNVKFKINRN